MDFDFTPGTIVELIAERSMPDSKTIEYTKIKTVVKNVSEIMASNVYLLTGKEVSRCWWTNQDPDKIIKSLPRNPYDCDNDSNDMTGYNCYLSNKWTAIENFKSNS